MKLSTKLCLFSAAMLLVPLSFWIADYQWHLSDSTRLGKMQNALIIITETGGTLPMAIATTAILTLLLLKMTMLDWRVVLLICVLSLGGTQVIKSALKQTFQQPRPYVEALEQRDMFYDLSRQERKQLVLNQMVEPEQVAVVQHHSSETGYAFPSGHSIFAVSWLLLFAGFLYRQRRWHIVAIQTALALWVAMVLFSRVRLGMHYPIDLLASTIIALLWHILLFQQVLPRLQQRFSIGNTHAV